MEASFSINQKLAVYSDKNTNHVVSDLGTNKLEEIENLIFQGDGVKRLAYTEIKA